MNIIKVFQFLTIKHVPHLFWRSPKALTIRPPIFSIFVLILGLVLFGLGEALLIAGGPHPCSSFALCNGNFAPLCVAPRYLPAGSQGGDGMLV